MRLTSCNQKNRQEGGFLVEWSNMDNQTKNNTQRVVYNSRSRYATVSFALAVIVVIVTILNFLVPQSLFYDIKYNTYGNPVNHVTNTLGNISGDWLIFIAPILFLIAIILGIVGSKSIKRKSAVLGIIISVIGFLILVGGFILISSL
jgi:uncharacterized BrkB/YihY/UPF0761 family membrane protein